MKKNLAIISVLIIVLILGSIVYWQYKNPAVKTPELPSITLLSPNGGETLKEGSVYTIKWITQNIPATNKIAINTRRVPPPALSEEGQEFDPLVFVGLENSGNVDWQIAEMYPEGNYILGITSYVSTPITDPISDESDAIFRIVKSAELQTYTNKKLGYSIDYPASWTFREFPDTQTGAGFRPGSSPEDVAAECITIDTRGTAGNEYSTPFEDYVKKAAIVEIQGFEKLNSVESVETANGLVGYKITWIYKDIRGQEKVSLPITYFNFEKTVEVKDSKLKLKTVQISLNSSDCEGIYNQMLLSFKLAE